MKIITKILCKLGLHQRFIYTENWHILGGMRRCISCGKIDIIPITGRVLRDFKPEVSNNG